jgi:hypothetical protein
MVTGLLLLRVAIGLLLAGHGGRRLFGRFGGDGRHRTGTCLAGPGEADGGLLALGLATPVAATSVAELPGSLAFALRHSQRRTTWGARPAG